MEQFSTNTNTIMQVSWMLLPPSQALYGLHNYALITKIFSYEYGVDPSVSSYSEDSAVRIR